MLLTTENIDMIFKICKFQKKDFRNNFEYLEVESIQFKYPFNKLFIDKYTNIITDLINQLYFPTDEITIFDAYYRTDGVIWTRSHRSLSILIALGIANNDIELIKDDKSWHKYTTYLPLIKKKTTYTK